MSDDYLLVPMQLDALVVNDLGDATANFLWFTMDYGALSRFDSPDPDPFSGGAPPGAGIYLHWTLPQSLRNGTHNEDGSTNFPCIPNRWVVVRTMNGASVDSAVKAWIIESDATENGTSAYINPKSNLGTNGIPEPKLIGSQQLLTTTLTITAQDDLFVQPVGPGNETFAAYAPGVMNVLAFYDNMTEVDGTTAVESPATFSYLVAGWYSSETHDPLASAKWTPSTAVPGTYVCPSLDWYVYADSDAVPTSMLLHSLVSGVAWNLTGANSDGPNYPTDAAAVQVALGNTSVDALAGIVRYHSQSPVEGDMVEAFQYNLLEKFDMPGSSEALDIAIRQHAFGASFGGTLWTVVGAESAKHPSLPAETAPPLDTAQTAALAHLNAQQAELDRQNRLLESMQWNLFSLWWKYHWNELQFKPSLPVSAALQTFMNTQLPLQVGSDAASKLSAGIDPAAEDWYFNKVSAQKNLVAELELLQTQALNELLALIEDHRLTLKKSSLPSYYSPNDPVLLVTGLGRATNFDPTGSLMCRLPSQMISALTVDGSSYCASGCTNTVQIPALVANAGLPDPIPDLNAESYFLSATLFAQDNSLAVADVQTAITALQSSSPTADTTFPPVAFAMNEWVAPWVPLLLDWQVTVLKEPMYTCPQGADAPEFNRMHWAFNGTDYEWTGPLTYTGTMFDESDSDDMQFSGRTFITPFLAVTMAEQLEQFVTAHSLRNPALEALLEDMNDYVQQISQSDFLSQRLSGLSARLVQRSYQGGVAPTGTIASLLSQSRFGFPAPNPDNYPLTNTAPWDFTPMRGSFFVIQKITVMDTFGRTFNLLDANLSDGTGEADFYPIVGRGVRSPTSLNPGSTRAASESPLPRMLQLPPRMTQDSQLSFRLISNDGHNADINQTAGANPVCGWIVPNHLDRSLAVYRADGTALGELYLSLQDDGTSAPAWQPDPTRSDAPPQVGNIENVYLRNILQSLFDRTDGGQGFADLMQIIDETLWTINPSGERYDKTLSVLIGRPLAVVRADVSLKLRGLPYYSQDWWNTFDVDPTNPPTDATQPAALGAVDGGVFEPLWDVRLGSALLRNDGVIGYFADNAEMPANTYQTFNTLRLPKAMQTNYLQKIGEEGNYIRLRFTDDTATNPDPASNQVCRITMLIDPRGSAHAFTGLLPVVELNIPDQFVSPALKQLRYLFRAGPFLTSPDAVRIPRPAERKGVWSWYDEVAEATTTLAPADSKARFPTTPPLIKEGWLKFDPHSPRTTGKARS